MIFIKSFIINEELIICSYTFDLFINDDTYLVSSLVKLRLQMEMV